MTMVPGYPSSEVGGALQREVLVRFLRAAGQVLELGDLHPGGFQLLPALGAGDQQARLQPGDDDPGDAGAEDQVGAAAGP